MAHLPNQFAYVYCQLSLIFSLLLYSLLDQYRIFHNFSTPNNSVMAFRDDWPKMQDGTDFDGKQLLTLVHSGNSPFHGVWDVNLLIQEIEENLGTHVIDIPMLYNGSNNYVRSCLQSDSMLRLRCEAQGFHLKLSNQPDIVARLARGDVNMPNFDGFPIEVQVPEAKFEVAVYELLRSEPDIMASRLLYHRIPVQHIGPRLDPPKDIAGRRLFVFEKAEGKNNVWYDLSPEAKVRANVSRLLHSIQVTTCSPGQASFSLSPYSCITVQLQSPS